jgi:DNA-binding MarR family transcriptional regulator
MENEENINPQLIENQLCFPLYTAAREIIRHYDPLLKELDLTYTQYIAMLVLWEHKTISLKDMGKVLYLDSGTLTPLLKKLETKGYLKREKDKKDERNLLVSLSKKGSDLQLKAKEVPYQIGSCLKLTPEEAHTLYNLLYKVIGNLEE